MNEFLGYLKDGQNFDIDPDVYSKLLEDYGGLINEFIKRIGYQIKFSIYGIDYNDLYQCGCLLLIIAHKNYDPTTFNDVKFQTYFSKYLIRGFKSIIQKRCVNFAKLHPDKIKKTLENVPQKSNHYLNAQRSHLEDCLDSLYKDGKLELDEVQILRMRSAGYTYEEIGLKLDRTGSRIHQQMIDITTKIKSRHQLFEWNEKNKIESV